MGKMYPDVEQMENMLYAGYEDSGQMAMGPSNIIEHRKTIETEMAIENSPFLKMMRLCNTEIVTFDATKFEGVSSAVNIHVHKVKGVEDIDRPALVYFHGGAFCFGNATLNGPWACQHAVNLDVTVFCVDYGMAPENKAPGGALNCYAALKYILSNPKKFKIDPKRVAINGESSGGYLVACVSMELAKRDESHLVKFAWLDVAMLSNHWLTRTKENSSEVEFRSLPGQLGPLQCNATDWPNQKEDPNLFPVLMSEEIAAKVPMTLITGREFDCYKRDCLEYAELMRKHDKLLMEPYI
jgi:acetyl esterase/lipase